ncbi:hypothetical protein [Dinoroseobacter shibae]|uniref:hypothetical protein n=1 Tax=Dinoroseobacter shibae TaxID=215813 RepID=UPI0002E577F2|nr:hypothetical protein [Dinoroseobacter shibae]URF48055.1 hypothetical protein M8008_07150 [Dinoroseobacter shibae]URF52365.1 hypothetical protein M8007_07150 [Dinoroseobacter shibae]
MTSHRYASPDVILLDIPGTGAQALRDSFGAAVETRLSTGFDAPGVPRIAAVRHPLVRMARIIAQFRDGESPGAKPRLPGLTWEGALEILENPRTPCDHSRSYPQAQLKACLAPQTHPIRRLHEADHLIRAECFAQDYARAAEACALPMPARIVAHAPLPEMSPEVQARALRFYKRDFEILGYRPDADRPVQPASMPEAPGAQVWDLWPAFFEQRDLRADAAAAALPMPGVPLAPFASSLTGGRRGKTWAGREANLIRHFRKLQPEFADQSRLAHLLGAVIVVMRRVPDCREAHALFSQITDAYASKLAQEMKLRWLVSVCDSFADHGASQAQRAMGIAGSLLANTLKLTETERKIYDIPRPWPPKARWGKGGALFDGMISYWVEKGEMIDLMTARLEAVCAGDPQAGPFTREILARAHRHNTVYRRLVSLAGKPAPPRLDPELQKDLRKLVQELL